MLSYYSNNCLILLFYWKPLHYLLGLPLSGVAKRLLAYILLAAQRAIPLSWLSTDPPSKTQLLHIIVEIQRIEFLTATAPDTLSQFNKCWETWVQSAHGETSLPPSPTNLESLYHNCWWSIHCHVPSPLLCACLCISRNPVFLTMICVLFYIRVVSCLRDCYLAIFFFKLHVILFLFVFKKTFNKYSIIKI